MDIRQIVEDTLVAPMRAVATARQMTVTQERAATEGALDEMSKACGHNFMLHMGPEQVRLVLRHIDRLRMLADGYRDATSKHERMIGELLVLLSRDDLDGARDIVKAEYESIHGPRD